MQYVMDKKNLGLSFGDETMHVEEVERMQFPARVWESSIHSLGGLVLFSR